MMKILLIALFLLTGFAASAQDYDMQVTSAKNAFHKGDYRYAAQSYEGAFATGKFTVEDLYNAATAWTMAGEKEKGIYYLDLAAKKGFNKAKAMKQDKHLNELHDMSQWTEILEKVEKLERKTERKAAKENKETAKR